MLPYQVYELVVFWSIRLCCSMLSMNKVILEWNTTLKNTNKILQASTTLLCLTVISYSYSIHELEFIIINLSEAWTQALEFAEICKLYKPPQSLSVIFTLRTTLVIHTWRCVALYHKHNKKLQNPQACHKISTFQAQKKHVCKTPKLTGIKHPRTYQINLVNVIRKVAKKNPCNTSRLIKIKGSKLNLPHQSAPCFREAEFCSLLLPAMLIPSLRRCIVTPGTPQPKTLVLSDKVGFVIAPDGLKAGRLLPSTAVTMRLHSVP